MSLKQYLRIKLATETNETEPMYSFRDAGGIPGIYAMSANDDGSVNPELASTLFDYVSNPNDEFLRLNVGVDNVGQLLRRRQVYKGLVDNTKLNSLAETAPTRGNTEANLRAYYDSDGNIVHYNDPIDNYVLIKPDALMSDVLHEHGHMYNRNVRKKDYASGPEADLTAKTYGNYKIYNPKLLREVLEDERTATNYAKNVVNTIKDKNLRKSMLNEINDNLENAYKTYDVNYGRLLRAHNLGNYGVTALGGIAAGAGLGYLGYRGGNALTKKFKIKNDSRLGKALRYGGAIVGGVGGGIGGAYLSNKYLGDRVGNLGQIAVQKYDNATGYKAKKLNELYERTNNAAQKYRNNIDKLEEYINSGVHNS